MKTGIGVSKGYAIGTAYVMEGQGKINFQSKAENPDKQEKRLTEAVRLAKTQVREIADQAKKNLDKKTVEIVESHLSFLDDPAFIGEAFQAIRNNGVTAEQAISDVTQSLYRMFSDFDDEYTKRTGGRYSGCR